jgi:hypothetical protein
MRPPTLLLTAWLAGAGLAGAQTPPPSPLTRADVQASFGWQNLREPQPFGYDNWINALVFGDAAAGLYWTDHLRTQIDAGTTTEGQHYRGNPITVDGLQGFETSRELVRERTLSISQQYQFFRNAFFHPHAGAGVEIIAQRRTANYDPTVVFDPITHGYRTIAAARTEGPATRWIARPFVDLGYKAYMNRRAFFVNDARVGFRSGIEEVRVRFGFGVDF